MKIKDIVEKNSMIIIKTNNASRPDFVYPIDKFDTLISLEKEINKSRMNEAEKYSKKLFKVNKLKNDFEWKKIIDKLLEVNK